MSRFQRPRTMTILYFPFRGQQMPMTWQDRLDSANNERDVVSVARDFLAQLSPEEIAALPEACRPSKMFDANDITSYALALVRHNCDSKERTAVLVHKLIEFFSNASVRLSQVQARSDAAAIDDGRQSA